MATTWAADTEPNERFCLYTRGNVGEVFPNVITVLTGTLIGEAVRASQVDLFVELGVLRRAEVTGPSMGTGVFSGYLYMNGSTMRLFGVRMPGMDPATATSRCSAPSRTSRRTSRRRATGTWPRRSGSPAPASGCSAAPTSRRSTQARRDAQDWLRTMPDLAAGSDAELLRVADHLPAAHRSQHASVCCGQGWWPAPPGRCSNASSSARAPNPGWSPGSSPGRATSTLRSRPTACGTSAGWSPPTPPSPTAFDAGLDGIAERTRDSALQPELTAFLADHGHRGNDEYELATPAWVMDPGPVYAAIDRLRHVPDDRDPEATARRLQRRRGRRTGGGDGARGSTAAGDPPAHGERRPTRRHRT